MDTKTHYKNHLSKFYTWMFGDFSEMVQKQKSFFLKNNISPQTSRVAIDLGAGSGFQSLALSELGFKVLTVDCSQELLKELKQRNADVKTIEGDIRDLSFAKELNAELIVCMGDTITHLSSKNEVFQLIENISEILASGGRLVFTFRDLSQPKSELDRFIPVRSDDSRILACFLEDDSEQVRVTDLFWEHIDGNWSLTKSCYKKIKLTASELEVKMKSYSFSVVTERLPSGLEAIIGTKV